MLRFRRHGSCRGFWDINGCRGVCAVVVLPMAFRPAWGWQLAAVRLPPGPGCESDVVHRLNLKCSDRAILAERRSQKKNWDINGCWDMNAKTWIGHMDLAEDPEIRRCWDMNPKTWILQRTLRYKDAETWIGDMDLAEDPEIHMDAYIRIRRHGFCRGSWDTYGCWDMNPGTWISQRILRYIWMPIYGSGDMDLAEETEIHMVAYIRIRRHGSCRGS